MAQTKTPSPMGGSIIDDYEHIVMQLIQETARFSAEGPGPDSTQEEADGNIRRLRTLTAALNAAVQGLQFMPRSPIAPGPTAAPVPPPPPPPPRAA